MGSGSLIDFLSTVIAIALAIVWLWWMLDRMVDWTVLHRTWKFAAELLLILAIFAVNAQRMSIQEMVGVTFLIVIAGAGARLAKWWLRRRVGGCVAIASPLKTPRGFRVYVLGTNTIFPYHPHRQVVAQFYAFDLVMIEMPSRRRCSVYKPVRLHDYYIFGQKVYAPVAGLITYVVNDIQDEDIGKRNRLSPAGNHVVIETTTTKILIAHFKQESIVVHLGDVVVVGQLLGCVGNSGNSTEPHLHVHAVTANDNAIESILYYGAACPISISGVRPLRGDCID